MLESAWEIHATTLANAQTSDAFIQELEKIIKTTKIDISKPSNVIYARDTRPSGPALVAAFEDGLKAMGVKGRDEGVQTTPVLHYLVRCINTKGTNDQYGEDSEEGYMKKLSGAFKNLVVRVFRRVFALSPDLLRRLVKLSPGLLLSIAPMASVLPLLSCSPNTWAAVCNSYFTILP